MSDAGSEPNARTAIADAFDAETDPLAQYEATFTATEADPFEPFFDDVLPSRDLAESTIADYDRLVRQWREHMHRKGRHPACPNQQHVERFAHHRRTEEGNHPRTIAEKLRKLAEIISYWQADPAYPHPSDYNPVALARSTIDLTYPERKSPPNLTLEELRTTLETVTSLRDAAIIACQLKLGLRATEVCNLRLDELAIDDSDLRECYPQLGTHSLLNGRDNAVYIPHDRSGNKSRRPRVLPVDVELQEIFGEYIRIRPNNGEPWVFLSANRHRQLRKQTINECWKGAFHPKYAETAKHRAVTSHYGRHFFSTYWRVEQDLNRELLKYMRGDTPGSAEIDERGAIDEYLHTYYEDIEDRYRNQAFVIFY